MIIISRLSLKTMTVLHGLPEISLRMRSQLFNERKVRMKGFEKTGIGQVGEIEFLTLFLYDFADRRIMNMADSGK